MKERIPEELRRLGRKEEENLLAFAAEKARKQGVTVPFVRQNLCELAFAAERSVSMMQAYCNREDLPKELWSVGVALAQRLLDAADVKSMQEGDVSVTFAESRAETELLADFRTELDRFRRADW